MDRAEPNPAMVATPAVPVSGVWRSIRSYILWSHERGTIHYDVMVTLILLFVFFSPQVINFKDKPVEHNPHRTGVVVAPDGKGGFIYEIEARDIKATDDPALRSELLSIIEPISGEVTISSYEAVYNRNGSVSTYKVWVQR
jgi:hypothetical protein